MRTARRSAAIGAILISTLIVSASRAYAVNVCTAAEIVANEANATDCPVSATLPCLIDKTNMDVVSSTCTFDFGTRDVTFEGTMDIGSNSVTFISRNFLVSGYLNARGQGAGAEETTTGGNITIQASGLINIQSGGRLHTHGDTIGGKITLNATGGSVTIGGTLDAKGNNAGASAGASAITASTSISIDDGSSVLLTGGNPVFVPTVPKLALTANGGGVTINELLDLDGGGNAAGLTLSATGNVTVGGTATIDVGANSATINCNNFTMSSGAYLDARGLSATPADLGGIVTITALAAVDIQRVATAAAIDAGGNATAGRISITAGTSLNIGGRLNVDGLGAESDAGIITVDAGTTITTGASSDLSGMAPFGHAGGDMTFTAGACDVCNITIGTPIVNLDGGDGGALSLSAGGSVTMAGMTAKGIGTGFVQDLGSGGFMDVAAGLGITINGAVTANGTSDGCGGCVQGFADFGNIAVNGSIDTNSISPYEGGAGGQIALNAPGTITVASGASLTAFGDGGYGCGGTIDLDGVLGVTVNGALDAKGGSGGGFICIFSDADISITNSITASGIAAAGVGGDLTVNAGITGPGNLTISNTIDVTGGGCTMIEGCGTGGSASLEGCNVNLTDPSFIDARAPSGTGDVTITAHESLTIAGDIDARFTTDPFGDDGQVTLEYRTGIVPSITGTIQPAPLHNDRPTCTALSVPMDCLTACPICGNGTVEYPETCDPSVQMPPVNCDGCTRFCRTESCVDDDICTTDACDPTLGCHYTLNPPCPTFTPSLTPTGGTLTPTRTRTVTPTRTGSRTQTPTVTLSPTGGTLTPTHTPTISPTVTLTRTPTLSPTLTGTQTPTITPTVTLTATITTTPTITPTRTPTVPVLTISNAAGRPGGPICLAARLSNAGSPTSTTNDIGDFTGLPFVFESVAINPAIGPSTAADKQVARMPGVGVDNYTVSGSNMVGIPDGDLYTARYTSLPIATGTYNLTQPLPGFQIIMSTCTGDCDGSGTVALAEVQTCINKFLGAPICNPANSPTNCPVADINGNNTLDIGELQQCVLSFTGSCAPSP